MSQFETSFAIGLKSDHVERTGVGSEMLLNVEQCFSSGVLVLIFTGV